MKLHLIANNIFFEEYYKFIVKNFSISEHNFLVIDGVEQTNLDWKKEKNLERFLSNNIKNRLDRIIKLYLRLYSYSKKADSIYIHGFFDNRIILFYFIFNKFLKKSNWIVWGGDLYCYEKRTKSIKNFLWYKIEDYVKKHVRYVNTLAPEDYEIAKKYYKVNGKYKRALYTSNNNFDFIDTLKPINKKEIYIQIGNSADKSNNHIEILDTLSKFRNEKIKIFCILAYGGDQEYIAEVIKYGKNIFKDKFIPMLNFLPKSEYWKYLINIDILVFNHRRQQGLGNIVMLSYLEKKIYLRKDISSWNYLTKDVGLKLNSYEKIKNYSFEEFVEKNAIGNKDILLKTLWSNEYRKKVWEKNFEEN